MKNRTLLFSLALTLMLLAFGAWTLTFFHYGTPVRQAPAAQALAPLQGPSSAEPVFSPPRPQDAPENIRDAVMLGYNIINDTAKFAPNHVGNELTCAACHLDGGRSKDAIPLVGVAATYPRVAPGNGGVVDLATRVRNCFARNLNATPPAYDSREMRAVLAYLQWISKGVPVYAKLPWALPASLGSQHKPDPAQGAKIYADQCAMCHGDAGEGSPALWGKGAYTDGSALHGIDAFAVFTHKFMPKDDPSLTPEQSLDVAAFVNSQPHPRFADASPAQGTAAQGAPQGK